MFGMFFLGLLYLRRILGYDPLQIGLAFLPVAVVMGALSVRYTDRLVMRFGARRLMFPGLGLIAAGLALFAMTPAGGTYLSYVFPVTLLIGTGAGLCFPALMTLAMSSATPQDAGLASGREIVLRSRMPEHGLGDNAQVEGQVQDPGLGTRPSPWPSRGTGRLRAHAEVRDGAVMGSGHVQAP
jgi:hypothetical protein